MKSTLEGALPIVAAAYGKKFDTRVVMKGSTAYTDGHCIVIPALSPDDQAIAPVVWGFLSHEAAHIRYTDFSVVSESGDNPFRQAVFNVIEDIRVERAITRDYPGILNTLAATMDYLVDHQLIQPADPDDAVVTLIAWLVSGLRCEWLAQTALMPHFQQAQTILTELVGDELIARLSMLLSDVGSLSTSREALQLTDRLLDIMVTSSQNVQQTHISTTTDVTTELTDDLFTTVAGVLTQHAVEQNIHDDDVVLPEIYTASSADTSRLGVVSAVAGQLMAKLNGLVEAFVRRRVRYSRQGVRIDTGRLYRLITDDLRVFRRTITARHPDAAVQVLIDVSGSMRKHDKAAGSSYVQIAQDAALALALALERITGVSVAVSVFHEWYETPASVGELVSFGQSVRHRSDCFSQAAGGSTPLAQALWYGAGQLLQQPRNRRLMIVLTDGEPDNIPATLDVITRCQASQIELIGIGIVNNAIEQLIPASVTINDISELHQRLFGLMHQWLLSGESPTA